MAQEHDTSPSAIKALAECPEKFFLGSVAKDPRRFTKTTPANTGILVHDVLARETVRLSREERVEGAPLVFTRKALLAALDAPIPLDAEPQTVEARLDLAAVKGAREILKTAARMIDLRALYFDEGDGGDFPLVEQRTHLNVDGTRVLAVLDRVDARSSEITVVDYKTGADMLDKDELRLDPQAGIYGAVARALWPDATIRVAFHYLQRDVWVSQEHTPEVDAWARQVVRDHMGAVAWYEKRGRWPTRPGRACADCPFRRTCRGYAEALKTGEVVDLAKPEGLDATAAAFGAARDVLSLYEKRVRDLAEPLRGALVERGEEFTAGGRKVAMGKRSTPKFPFHQHTLKRASELTGLPFDELVKDCLVISSKKLDEKIDALDVDKASKRAIKAAIDDTGTLDVATWVEARKLPDPFKPALVEETGAQEAETPCAPTNGGGGAVPLDYQATVCRGPVQEALAPPALQPGDQGQHQPPPSSTHFCRGGATHGDKTECGVSVSLLAAPNVTESLARTTCSACLRSVSATEPEASPALAALPEGAVCPRTLSLRHWASASGSGGCAVCGKEFVPGYEHPVTEPGMVADLRPFQTEAKPERGSLARVDATPPMKPAPHAETGLPPPKAKRSRKKTPEIDSGESPLASSSKSMFPEEEAPKAW